MLDSRLQTESAVSPVVAVILMVAVTVILSAVIGTFVLDLGQQTTSEAEQQNIGVTESVSNGTATVTIVTGSASKVKLLVNGTAVDTVTNASPGDVLSGSVNPQSTVVVVAVNDGSQSVVMTVDTGSSSASTASTVSAPSDGLLAHWKFDSGSGSTATDSAGSRDASLINETAWTTTSKTGSYALTYDGVDDYVSAPEATPSNFTLSAWVKTTDNGVIIDRAPNPSSSELDGWRLWITSAGVAKTGVADGGGACSPWCSTITGSTNVSDGQWHHIVSTYESGTLKLYIDGVKENSSTTANLAYSNSRSIYFATTSYSGEVETGTGWMLNGEIDDGRIYNRSLNSSEVQDLYNATK